MLQRTSSWSPKCSNGASWTIFSSLRSEPMTCVKITIPSVKLLEIQKLFQVHNVSWSKRLTYLVQLGLKTLEGDWTIHPSPGNPPQLPHNPVCSGAHRGGNGFHSSQWLHLQRAAEQRVSGAFRSATVLCSARGARLVYFSSDFTPIFLVSLGCRDCIAPNRKLNAHSRM